MSEIETELKIESEPKLEPELEPEPESKTITLAKEWLEYILKEEKEKNVRDDTCIKIKLPIETIDELPVIVEIVFKRYLYLSSGKKNVKKVEFHISTNKKHGGPCENQFYLYHFTTSYQCVGEEEGENWSISMLEKCIISIASRLNNLKFDCYGSRFGYTGYTNMELLKDIFKGSNITHLDEECCVCKDDTMCKTKCGHNLCLRCWSKLKVEKICEGCGDDDCECVNEITEGHICPICRSFMKLNIC